MAAKIESIEGQPADAATGSDDKLNQQLRTIVEDLQRIGIQPSPVEEDEPVERDDLRRVSHRTSTRRLRSARQFMIVS